MEMLHNAKIGQVQNFNQFFEAKQEEILAIAQRNTEEVVKRETALMNFEITIGLDFSEKERGALTKKTRAQRIDTWNNLTIKSKGQEMNKIIDSF